MPKDIIKRKQVLLHIMGLEVPYNTSSVHLANINWEETIKNA